MTVWAWTPNVAVGPIALGGPTPAEAKLVDFRLTELNRDGSDLWTYYWNQLDEVEVIACNGRVASAAFHKALLHRGVNLVGLTDSEVRMQFRDHSITVGEFPDGHTLEVDDLGLELTILDGHVSIASVVGPDVVVTGASRERRR